MDNFKKIGKKIVDFLGVFIPNITFLVIFLTFMVTIVSRYFFKTPVTWSYEVSVLGYMWTMFFGVGKAMEADEHVVFGLVYDAVKPRTQFIFKVVYNTFLLILLVTCFVPKEESPVSMTRLETPSSLNFRTARSAPGLTRSDRRRHPRSMPSNAA